MTTKAISLVAVMLLVTACFAGFTAAPAAADGGTMMQRYDARQTGDYSPVAGSVLPNNLEIWRFPTGQSPLASTPAIVNGLVYIGGWSGSTSTTSALDAATGHAKWQTPLLDNGVVTSPAVTGGVVYFGSSSGKLYALDATTGSSKWKQPVDLGGYIGGGPTVANAAVYVASGQTVYALNASTGAPLWNYPTGDYVFSSPAATSDLVFVGSDDGHLYALNAGTGEEVWNYTTGGWVQSCPAYVNGVVYFGSGDHHVYALYADSGTELWNYTTGAEVWSSPAVSNGVVYIGSDDNRLYALNATTGVVLWNRAGWSSRSPAVADGVVYVGIEQNLTAIDANTGAWLWNFTTQHLVLGSPAIANGVVYVTSMDTNLYAIGKPTPIITIDAPSIAAVNKNFAIKGTLTNASVGLAKQSVVLQRSTEALKWADLATNVTTDAGAYQFSQTETKAGTVTFRVVYSGNDTYAANVSTSVSVKVVSKTTVQRDLATLEIAVNSLPASAFYPHTKGALLSVLSAAELQLRYDRYGLAAKTLESKVLVRMDGCARTGRPDLTDLVRTCAAQGQLYPLVQNLIQELNALQDP